MTTIDPNASQQNMPVDTKPELIIPELPQNKTTEADIHTGTGTINPDTITSDDAGKTQFFEEYNNYTGQGGIVRYVVMTEILKLFGDSTPLPPDGQVPTAAEIAEALANPWFDVNPLVTFLRVFAESQKTMQKDKLLQNLNEVKMMEMAVEMAKVAASLIMKSANAEAMMHLMMATMNFVQAGMGAGSLASGLMASSRGKAKFARKNKENEAEVKDLKQDLRTARNWTGDPSTETPPNIPKIEKKLEQAKASRDNYRKNKAKEIADYEQAYITKLQAINQVGSQTIEGINHMIQAFQGLEKAEYDAAKEVVQGYRDIIRQMMSNYSDAYKADSDALAQLFNMIKSLFDDNTKSMSFSTKG